MKGLGPMGGLLAIVVTAACGGESAEPSGAIVWDSAGVRVVENREASTEGWRVGEEPLFTVGWESDGPMFNWIQSGRILPDGGALLGEFQAGAVYRIGAEGSVVETRGRKGEGPGEFQSLDAIVLHGDSILVSDGRLQRATLLAQEGGVRTIRLAGGFLHSVSAIMDDGRLLLVPGEGSSGTTEIRAEWVFETQPILAVDPGGIRTDTLAQLPHLRRWYGTPGASPGPVHVKGRAGGFAEGFAWARSDEREVRWYDGSGRVVQISRWDEEPASLTRDRISHILQAYEDLFRSGGADESFVAARLAEVEEGLGRYEGPLPYWDSLHVDRLGNVWLSAYVLPGARRERWRVFARDGTFRGWVDVPGAVEVLDITDNRVLAVRIDELDVPAAVMLELIKP